MEGELIGRETAIVKLGLVLLLLILILFVGLAQATTQLKKIRVCTPAQAQKHAHPYC
jgi:hypothetical protein